MKSSTLILRKVPKKTMGVIFKKTILLPVEFNGLFAIA